MIHLLTPRQTETAARRLLATFKQNGFIPSDTPELLIERKPNIIRCHMAFTRDEVVTQGYQFGVSLQSGTLYVSRGWKTTTLGELSILGESDDPEYLSVLTYNLDPDSDVSIIDQLVIATLDHMFSGIRKTLGVSL